MSDLRARYAKARSLHERRRNATLLLADFRSIMSKSCKETLGLINLIVQKSRNGFDTFTGRDTPQGTKTN